ncbi:hypothetical protein AVEN_205155-1 [Araneus ventricosus]|uniref:Uncharacterized protein n=1 Tax=Araneus ventricosus TaxID=182803 RepID=A0A4Y2UDD0_ARAVE|nr:hypothetical protein AVEN_205155-1 [Araneus ventricosus]
MLFSISLIISEDCFLRCCFPPLTNSPPITSCSETQCNCAALRWSALGYDFPQAQRYHYYPPQSPHIAKTTQSRSLGSIWYCLRFLNVTFDSFVQMKLL